MDHLMQLLDGNETVLQRARRQLADAKYNYWEGPEGTFHACGTNKGCGYTEATVVVDDETGLATVRIASGVRVPEDQIGAARKICRRLNQDFIVPGLDIADDGEMVFAPRPVDLNDAEADVNDVVSKGFTTIHGNARVALELELGRDPWDVLDGDDPDEEDDHHGDLMSMLRSLAS